LVGLLLGRLLIDYLLRLDRQPRLLLLIAAVCGVGYVIFHWIFVPWRSNLGVGAVAGKLESSFPQFDDRLRSTVNFTNGQIPGSSAMQQRVMDETTELAKKVNFERAIARKPVYLSIAGAVASIMLLGGLAAWGAEAGVLGIALNRLALGNHPWPKSVEIAMLGDAPKRVAAGQRVPIVLKLIKGDRDSRAVTIRYRYDNGPWQTEQMNRSDIGQYTAMLDARLEQGKQNANLDIKLEAGDDEKELSTIAVVPRLEVAHVEAQITPPPYVQSPTISSVNMVERTPTAAVGSQVAIKIDFNKQLDPKTPVEFKPVTAGAQVPAITWDRSLPGSAVARFQAEKSMRFNIRATDSDGFQNSAGEEYELAVREDQPPTVQIEEPKRSEERTAVAAFDIRAVAEDDYGIVGAQLVVHRINDGGKNNTAKNEWTIDLVKDGTPLASNSTISWELSDSTPEHKRYRLLYNWQLEQLESAALKAGDVLEYYVQVKDNFDLNGKQHDWVPSGKLRLTIISQEQLLASIQGALEQIQQMINAQRLAERRQQTETDTLREGMQRRDKFDEADKTQISRLANDQSGTASQTMQVAEKLQQLVQRMNENKSTQNDMRQTAQDVQKLLQQTADGAMRQASTELSTAKDQPLTPGSNQQPQPQNTRQNQTDQPQKNAADPNNDQQQKGEQQKSNNQQQDANQQNGQQQNGQQPNAQQRPGDNQPNSAQPNRDGQQEKNQQSQNGEQKQSDKQNQPGQQNQEGKQNQDGKQNQAGQQKQNGQQQSGQQQAQSGQQNQSGQQQSGQQQTGEKQQQTAQQQEKNNQQPNAKQNPQTQRRTVALAKASQNQQTASEQLQQAMDKLGQMGGLQEAIDKMQELRDKQEKVEKQFRDANKENIGKKNTELKPEDQQQNKKMAEEQRKEAQELDQALTNMEKKAEQMNRADPQASQAMKQAAQSGRQQQIQSKQQQAAENMEQNQQAQAQQNQKQAELGIDVILNRLKEAERRRLEELAKQLSTMQQLINELITRQAGHNVDNLLLQGGAKRIEQVESSERDDLLDYANRDPKNLGDAPPLGQLTASQEQTERNARDVGKQAEALPDPAPAAKITQAAGHMERAIVHLRNNKPVDAYEPPQVEALRALVEAKKQIDETLKKANDELEKQDSETLKQMYVNLLANQKKIGTDIVAIDKTPKENGDLPRDIAIKLGQLPGDQGKLIEDANKIGEKLKQLDSIVYDWANKDIVKSMGDVKEQLAKPQTGQPTQVAEAHVEEQLQAMVDSLVQKIKKREFNARNNQQQAQGQPGQSGQQKPKLPTEAELRLLKRNQEIINKGTEVADAADAKEKDKPVVLDLGTRQGSLRNLLDQLVQKASEGKQKLGPEPDNRDQLPEEASKEQIEDDELTRGLLSDNPDDDSPTKKIKLTGDRMGRSRQRLALNDDPGKVTQEIQKKIVIDIDDLISAAQAQQARMQQSRRPGQRRQPGQQRQPNPGQQQIAQGQQNRMDKGGQNPAQQSRQPGEGEITTDTSADIKQKIQEWGKLTPRDRQAVEETAHEQAIGKYKTLVDDYYRNLAEQASKK
jgi:hypothetical protein